MPKWLSRAQLRRGKIRTEAWRKWFWIMNTPVDQLLIRSHLD
jgi:hypothetical protein